MSESTSGQLGSDEQSYSDLLDDQAEQWGEDELDEEGLMEGLDDEAVEDGEASAGDASSEAAAEGTDVVLGRLDEQDPSAARVVRAMQRRMAQNQNEWNELRDSNLAIREELLEMRKGFNGEGAAEQEPTAEDRLAEAGLNDQHVETFKLLANTLGYTSEEERETKDASSNSEALAERATLEAARLYGESFGTVDEAGQVSVDPTVQRAMQAKLEEITDPAKGITTKDLFLLTHPEIAAEAERLSSDSPRRSTGMRSGGRRSVSNKANVVRRSAGSSSGSRIYNASRGDSASDVLDRAWIESRQELTR